MKSNLLVLSVFLFLSQGIHAQWTRQYQIQETPSLLFVQNKDTVYIAAGNEGKIYHTFNGGQSWQFSTAQFGYAPLHDIHFPSARIGYACGGTSFGAHNVFIKTTDAGISWDTITINAVFAITFSNIHFVNDSVGFVSGWFDGLLKTTDGGNSFNVTSQNILLSHISEVYFMNEDIGFVAAVEYSAPRNKYKIYRTSDQGKNWNIVYSDSTNSTANEKLKTINKIEFVDSINGFAVGNNGTFLKTTNGGSSWTHTSIAPFSSDLNALSFISPTVGYTNNTGSIYRTADGGDSWNVQAISPLSLIRDISMANDSIGYAIGNFGIYKTINGGGTSVGIRDRAIEKKIKIYPNPAKEMIHIETEENIPFTSLILMDNQGKKVREYKKNERELNIKGLSSGVYFLKMKSLKEFVTEKIIIE